MIDLRLPGFEMEVDENGHGTVIIPLWHMAQVLEADQSQEKMDAFVLLFSKFNQSEDIGAVKYFRVEV